MEDDLSGVISLSDRVAAQHNHKTTWHTQRKKSTSPPHLVHLERSHLPDCTCLRSPRGFHFTTPDWYTSVLDPTVDCSFQSHFAPDRSTHRSPRDLSDPLGQGSSHAPPSLPTHRAERRNLLPFLCHTIPPAVARDLFG